MIYLAISRKNNASRMYCRAGGFTLFELIVVILLLCGIYYVVIDRLMYYRAQYESAEVRWTIAAIHASRRAELAIKQQRITVEQRLELSRNPMRELGRLPHNYLGEICDPDVSSLEPGNWYFDNCNLWLVYIYNREKFFALRHPKILKFNVESLRLLTDPARTS
jgi:hypothetical protein